MSDGAALNSAPVVIEAIDAPTLDQHIDALGAILNGCVHDGASVGFILPFGMDAARRFFRESVRPALAGGKRIVLVAKINGQVVGTGQLNLDTMPNQMHRADVMKVLVYPRYQRRGIGRALMAELEQIARRLGRTVLVLDTIAGDKAEPLYLSLGYEVAGRIPLYARAAREDKLETTSVMFKVLDANLRKTL
ncbi:MAG: GNAT family N-acetyltransferase [Pseudomonadota bacterium]